MREIEAADELSALLDSVEAGEEVLITRRGKLVARLIPESREFDRQRARQAAERILERSRTATLGGLKLRDLINEGRR